MNYSSSFCIIVSEVDMAMGSQTQGQEVNRSSVVALSQYLGQ